MRLGYRFALLVLALIVPALASAETTTPSSLKMQVYQVAISTDPLCTNPVTIFKSDTALFVDLLTGPTLGSGGIPEGTYHCVILEIQDSIKFTPTASDGDDCVPGNEVTMRICDAGDYSGKTFKRIDGTTGGCDSSEKKIPLVLSTAAACTSTGPNCDANAFPFGIPTDATGTSLNGLKLANPMVVSGDKTVTFKVNAKDQVNDIGSRCIIEAPVFSFE